MSKATHRTTWTDTDGTVWRVEQLPDRWPLARRPRWQLSRWTPAVDDLPYGWAPVGSYPNRAAAIRAAHPDGGGL